MMLLIILETITLVLILLVTAVIVYFKWNFLYWKRRNIPGLSPQLFLGNLTYDVLWTHPSLQIKEWYRKLKANGVKYGGGIFVLATPRYIPVNPETIKLILQQDFRHFTDRTFYHNKEGDPLSENFAVLGGKKWKDIRSRVAPSFTPGKIKAMFNEILKSSENLNKSLYESCDAKNEVDIRKLANRYTTDIIALYVFGLDANSFDSGAEFVKQGEDIFESVDTFSSFCVYFAHTYPDFAKKLGVKLFAHETTEYFTSVFRQAIEFREANNIARKDALQSLIELKNEWISAKTDKTEALANMIPHAFALYTAGFETSSATITFCLYELALNSDIQTKLRQEIRLVLSSHQEELNYNAIQEMKYLSQVVDETLRKYPPVSITERKCVEEYRIPNTDVILQKGTKIYIPIIGLHYDPDYYPNPTKFDPERFSSENKQKMTPFTYLPFGEGPRICLASKLGSDMVKVAVAVVVLNYVISLSEKTETPVTFHQSIPTLMAKSPVRLNLFKAKC